MPLSALPPDLNPNINPLAWKGTDKDVWYARWKIRFVGWFAYGYRARQWWAKWRKFPLTVFSIKGKGYYRFETEEGTHEVLADGSNHLWMFDAGPGWLSVIQYWCRWSLTFYWPFHIVFHCYLSEKDVPELGVRYRGHRVVFIRIGARFDADKVYWFPSAGAGKFN